MHTNYNTNQLTLDISTSYIPKEDSTAWFINELVGSLEINEPYLFGRPRNYDLSALLKVVLFAYTRSVFSSRKIEQLAFDFYRWNETTRRCQQIQFCLEKEHH